MIHKIKSRLWSNKLRLKVGDIVRHNNGFYGNLSGINNEPEMNSNSNWVYLGEVEKDGSFILKTGANLTEAEIQNLQEILNLNLEIGFAADGTLDNGFDVPVSNVAALVFNQLDFDYEIDEENGTVLIKKKEGSGTGGDFVPLPGTTENKNITGDLQFEADGTFKRLKRISGTIYNYFNFDDDINSMSMQVGDGTKETTLSVSTTGVLVSASSANSEGIGADRYFGAKYNANSYVQKKYVDDNLGAVSASVSGIVDNVSLQELGGVDKLINGVRAGKGKLNNASSTVFGLDALSNSTGAGIDNSAFGANALKANTTGDSNSAFGTNALTANTTGWNNNAFGAFALTSNTTGLFNTSIGDYSMQFSTTGQWNTALGASALRNNTTGQRNIALSAGLYWNTSGSHNTALGMSSGYANSTGNYNTYVGRGSAYDNGLGSFNVALGAFSMLLVGGGYTNGGSVIDMNRNVFIGPYVRGAQGMNDTLAIDNKGATVTDAANALIYGGFSVANRFVKINGKFSVNPANMPAADNTYLKNIVMAPDGTFGIEDKVDRRYLGTELNTGEIWDNGKPIFKRVLTINIPVNDGNILTAFADSVNVDEIISFEKAQITVTGSVRKSPPNMNLGTDQDWSWQTESGYQLMIRSNASPLVRTVKGVMYYTKKP